MTTYLPSFYISLLPKGLNLGIDDCTYLALESECRPRNGRAAEPPTAGTVPTMSGPVLSQSDTTCAEKLGHTHTMQL